MLRGQREWRERRERLKNEESNKRSRASFEPRFPDYCMHFISYLFMLSTLSMIEKYVTLDFSL